MLRYSYKSKERTKTMKTYNELTNLTKEERFSEILNFVTTQIKNNVTLEVIRKSITGEQDKEVQSFKPALLISELCAKSFISAKQSDCLIELARVA